MKLCISDVALVALLGTVLPFARIVASFCICCHSVDVAGGNLPHACASLRVTSLFGPSFLVVLFLEEILSCARDLISRMNVNGLLFERQAAEGIDQEIVKLFIYIFLDIFSKSFKLAFLLQLELILDIPIRSEDSNIN